MYYIIIFLLIFQVNCSSICQSEYCVCKYNNKNDVDYLGEYIDCSDRHYAILRQNLTLPNPVYSLDVSANEISMVPPTTMLKSTTMVELYLNDNALTHIDASAFDLPQLRKLDLSNNQLSAIDKEAFRTMKQLKHLNLANNNFVAFAQMNFHHLGNLIEVYFDNNDIGKYIRENNLFDRSATALTNKIQVLSISGIDLQIVPDNFLTQAYDLRKLIISNNNLNDTFEIPFTLEYLDLSDNPITEISSEDFEDLPALKTLKLNNLMITEVPDFAFSDLRGLIKLELERNKELTNFNALAFGRNVLEDADDFTLEELSLSGSRVTTLDEKLSVPFSQLIRLDLQGNPWVCDCNILWLKRLQIEPTDYDHLRCGSPKPLFNARIFEMKDKYFQCNARRRSIGIVICVVFLGIVFSGIGICVFFYTPRQPSRNRVMQYLHAPSTAYSLLPMNANIAISTIDR